MSDFRGRPRRFKGVFSFNGLLSSFNGIIVVVVEGFNRLRDGLPRFSSSSSCVASSVSRMRHGLTFPSCSFSGESDLCRPPLNFIVGDPGSMTSLN